MNPAKKSLKLRIATITMCSILASQIYTQTAPAPVAVAPAPVAQVVPAPATQVAPAPATQVVPAPAAQVAPVPAAQVAPVVPAAPVAPLNQAPAVDGIQDQTIDEGGAFKTIQLDKFVSDDDHKKPQLKWSTTGQKNLIISINSARVVSIKAPNKDWNGIESVTFTATDPANGSGSQTITLTVNSINDDPIFKAIPSQTIPEGKTFAPIKLDEYIEDVDHPDDQIQWSTDIEIIGKVYRDLSPTVVLSKERVAAVSLPDTNWNGNFSITFTATDGEGSTASSKAMFSVTSINNNPIMTKISDQVIKEGEEFQPINLLEHVGDADHDVSEIKWQVSGGMKLKVKVAANGIASVVIPNENWNGPKETFTFTARDPQGGSIATDVSFTVTSVNDAPELSLIDGQTINEGQEFVKIDLKKITKDVDHQFAQLAWGFSGNKELKVKNVGGIATIAIPNKDWYGQETITFVVADPEKAQSQQTATFVVNSVNDLPVLKTITNQDIDEGKKFAVIKLDDIVNDIDHKDNQISWDFNVTHKGKVPETGTLNVALNEKREAIIQIPDTNWNGTATITFTAMDPEGGKATTKANFNVKSINDLPIVKQIPNQAIEEGNSFTTVMLDDYVSDADHKTSSLKWNTTGNKELNVIISKDRIATIKIPHKNWHGQETITFTVTDAESGKTNIKTAFNVKSINDIPELKEIKSQSIKEGSKFATLRLDDIVNDADHNDNQIKWSFSGQQKLKVNVDASRIATIEIPDSNWYGEEVLTFTATDPEKGSAQTIATFTVKSVNDIPITTPIPDQSIDEGSQFKAITLDNFVSDSDHKDTELSWAFTSRIAGKAVKGKSPELQVSIDEKRVAKIIIPNKNWHGAETVVFTITDPEGAKKSISANFTVRSVNDIPIFAKIPAQAINEGEEFTQINLSELVKDEDHNFKQLKWQISGNKSIKVNIDKSGIATLKTPNKDWYGKENVTFTVADPENGKATQQTTFTVKSINDLPILKEIKSQTIKEGKEFLPINLQQLISDADHKFGQLKWTTTGNKNLKVQFSGGNAKIIIPNKDWHGEETIKFTVTDPENGKTEGTAVFTVKSINDLPIVKNLPGQTINESQAFKAIKLNDFITDADHKPEQITWTFNSTKANKKAGELQVNVDAKQMATVVAPNKYWNGSEAITFTATDPENGKASTKANFNIRSINNLPEIKTIPNQTIKESEKFTEINLNDFTNDPDHKISKLMWNITGAKDLKVSIAKGIAKISQPNKYWNGSEKITFNVKDPEGGMAKSTVNFTATSVNNIPEIKTIPNQTFKEGATFQDIKLDDFVSDPDHKDNVLKWIVKGNKELRINISEGRIAKITTPNKDWHGEETVTFTVTDAEKATTSTKVTFKLTSINDIPVMKKIPDQIIKEKEQFTSVRLDDFINDADHKKTDLVWSAKVTKAGATKKKKKKSKKKVIAEPDIEVTIDGNRIAKISIPSRIWNGARNITFTAKDPEGGKASSTSSFSVKSINDLPVINKELAKPIVLNEGKKIPSITLNDLVSDADHSKSKLKWTVTGAKQLKANLNPKTNAVSIKAPSQNWYGKETIKFTVSDPEGGKSSVSKTYEIKSVNDIPVIKTVKDQTIKEGGSFANINLDQYVSDADHKNSELKWTISGAKKLKATVDPKRVVTIKAPNEDWHGPAEELTFTVTDPEKGTASIKARFTVTSVNDIPVLKKFNPIKIKEGAKVTPITLDNFVSDKDHKKTDLNWSVTVTNPTKAKKSKKSKNKTSEPDISATINANRVLNITTPNKNWHGDRVLNITVKDSEGGEAKSTIPLSVISVNDNPVLTKIPTQVVQEGKKFAVINLLDYVTDVDHSKKQLKWKTKGNKDLKVTISSKKELIVTTPNKDWSGKEKIDIAVADPEDGRVSTSVIYEATEVNDAPVINEKLLKGEKVKEGTKFKSLDLSKVAKDVDHKANELKWSVTGGKDIKVKIDPNKNVANIITKGKDWFGPKETFKFTVTDKVGASDSHEASFEVTPINDAPVVAKIPGQTIKEGEKFKTIDLNKFVKDIDNKTSEIIWAIDDAEPVFPGSKGKKSKKKNSKKKTINNKIKVIVDKGIATIVTPDENWNGKENIKFSAYDPAGATSSIMVPFTVTSVNDAPQVTSPEGEFAIDEGKKFSSIKLNALVTDVDHKTSQLKWSVTGARHLEAIITSKGVANISPKRKDWSGEERLTFIVKDPAGGKASFNKSFVIKHVNRVPVLKTIPNQSINEDMPFKKVNLNQYVKDGDHSNKELKWKITGNKSLIVDYNRVTNIVQIKAPRANWNGSTETICFAVRDPEGANAKQCAKYTVKAVNDAPIVLDHSFQGKEGKPLIVGAKNGLLNNSSDPDGAKPKTCILDRKPASGTLILKSDGSFKYTPKKGFYGLDQFTFKAKDKEGKFSKSARCEINIQFKVGDVR